MKVSNWGLGARLGLGFATVLLLMIAMAAFGVLRVSRIIEKNQEIADRTQRYVLAARWKADTQLNLSRALAIAKSGNSNALSAFFKPQIKATSAEIADAQKALETLVQDERGKAQLAAVAQARTTYMAARESILGQMQSGDAVVALARVDSEMTPAATT
jgi:hypothetical protein